MNNIAIVGGGPAGVYCALNIIYEFYKLDYNDFSISIFDKSQILRTLLPTGGGRCNLSNSIYDIKEFCSNYPRGEKFLYSVYSRYFTYDALDFFKFLGIETYTQPDGRIFPKSNSAKDVRDKMFNYLKKHKNIKIINKKIDTIQDVIDFDKIVISAGSRNTQQLIKSTGHSMIEFKNALCALIIDDNKFPKGVSVKTSDGDIVFTDNGISGPLAFKISSLNAYSEFPYNIKIKLFSYDELINEIKINPKKSIGNIVSKFIPRSLSAVLVDNYMTKAAEISKSGLKKLTELNLSVISHAQGNEIVKAGGVNLDELNKNIKSKIVDNLWFCGEILNIDGFCGGFNLQNCWSSAAIVAKDVVSSIINISNKKDSTCTI